MRFSDHQTSATILFDLDEHVVALSPSNERLARLNDKMAAAPHASSKNNSQNQPAHAPASRFWCCKGRRPDR